MLAWIQRDDARCSLRESMEKCVRSMPQALQKWAAPGRPVRADYGPDGRPGRSFGLRAPDAALSGQNRARPA